MSTRPHGNSSASRLVIFGCGYVGAAVAEAALALGWDVTALTRNSDTALALRTVGVRTFVADIAGNAWHEQVAASPEYVLNCVGAGGTGNAGYRHSYLGGMESILRWTSRHPPLGTFVYTSSTSVYPQDGGVMVHETAPTDARNERGEILCATERRLTKATDMRRWFILRLAGIYGPGRHHLLDQVTAGVVAGPMDHHLNLVHRHDIVAAVMACFQAPPEVRNEIFNVVDDQPAAKADVVAWTAGKLGVPPPRGTGMVGGRGVAPDRIIANGKLKRMLGWTPRYRGYREGYAEILGSNRLPDPGR
ncbi:MAG TPA: NAD-dependent epimerase/dehydratase family protein [Opitutaceae bacterium]|nr:NAD-dependent epimerase/dehydratase family protein [Opitutaceae bacterium]